jgi:hypothetical protein
MRSAITDLVGIHTYFKLFATVVRIATWASESLKFNPDPR